MNQRGISRQKCARVTTLDITNELDGGHGEVEQFG